MQRYVGECVNCETGKGRSNDRVGSPENLQATYPFQILAMNHIPSLPRFLKEIQICCCGSICSQTMLSQRRALRELHRRSEKSMKNAYFEDLVRLKPSVITGSQDLCPISSERSTKSRDRSNGSLWLINLKRTELQNAWFKL